MMHTSEAIIPHLSIRDAAQAIEFYKNAFGFTEITRMPTPDGKIMHCEMHYGPCVLMLHDEFPGMASCQSPSALGGTTVTIHLNCPDVDSVFARAVAAGAKATMPVTDMFWGDRYGKLKDPFGHEWSLSTHQEDVPPEQMKERAEAMMKRMKP